MLDILFNLFLLLIRSFVHPLILPIFGLCVVISLFDIIRRLMRV